MNITPHNGEGFMKKSTLAMIFACFAGLCLFLYPSVSNYWNTRHSTKVINHYVDRLSSLSIDEFRRMWDDAVEYNRALSSRVSAFSLSEEQRVEYHSLLNFSGDGVMGYIEIDALAVNLPVCHGTSEAVLQKAIGHLEWSSLPVGGEGAHCVVSGHRGLPNMKLFTELNKLKIGDTFVLNVLGQSLTYEVDQIKTVLPNEMEHLASEPGKDLCTLVTCTPYGINTHRLLVRGHRIENIANVRIVSEAVEVDPFIVAPIVAFPFLFTLFLMVMLKKPKKKTILNDFVGKGGNAHEQ